MTTYNQLLADLKAWVEDDGTEYAASIPRVITLGEERLQRDLDLGIFSAIGTRVTTTGDPLILKPSITDAFVFMQVYIDISSVRNWVLRRSVDFVTDYLSTITSGIPKYYAEYDQTQWLLAPRPASGYEVTGRALIRPTRLATGTQNTWLGDNMGDLLFKACLAESEGFLKGDDRVEMWKQQYKEALPLAKRDVLPMLVERYEITPLEIPAQPSVTR